ncbi:hypothetical protein BDA96_05G222000 [Sorghum bicolor]|uniref:Uncharacterized protein n=1 Tax=Sorghum bicolor TaxID=4558 RepID=A0A921UGK8_SORBI|nr:hypothetical protein BDA96_05G222000 [Sorghum bicolor]
MFPSSCFLSTGVFLAIQLILIGIIGLHVHAFVHKAGCGWGDPTDPCGPTMGSPSCHRPPCH